ncbi:hypothetical protein RJT34_15701 [Clitoria ternatea]|uniref:Uncharacterized protein n=1 Tax=Clitoria ternatea TaxID=43366 RepID=A0AAN9PCY5_CLITE
MNKIVEEEESIEKSNDEEKEIEKSRAIKDDVDTVNSEVQDWKTSSLSYTFGTFDIMILMDIESKKKERKCELNNRVEKISNSNHDETMMDEPVVINGKNVKDEKYNVKTFVDSRLRENVTCAEEDHDDIDR